MNKERLEHLMHQLEAAFIPDKSEGFEGVFQCHIPGDEGGNWVMTVMNQQCQIKAGIVEHPRATLTIEGDDLDELLSSRLDPLRAFFSGKIQLAGDNMSVIKLLSMFNLNPKGFN